MTQVTITIDQTDTAASVKGEFTPRLPDNPEDFTLAQTMGVVAMHAIGRMFPGDMRGVKDDGTVCDLNHAGCDECEDHP